MADNVGRSSSTGSSGGGSISSCSHNEPGPAPNPRTTYKVKASVKNSASVSASGPNGPKTVSANGHGPKKKVEPVSSRRGDGIDDILSSLSDSKPRSTTTTAATTTTASKPQLQTTSKRQLFLDIVKQSNLSCQNGDYSSAIKLYTEALKSDPNNHILYSNRSAALLKLGYFNKALQDANKARDLHPKWSKAYYRQGVALQCLGKHAEAIAAFSSGLAEDSKSAQLLSGLIEASIKSPLKGKLEPTLHQLNLMKLSKSPFVVISVIGQELLAQGFFSSAATVLENALRISTNNMKLNGSVLSALSSAYWALNSLDKAINYMQQDLAVAKSLGDVPGECRGHGNLGSAYFTKANYKEALTSHRYQLVLAMKCKDTQAATGALTSLGHVYTAIGDYANALASHKQCVQLVKQLGNRLQEAREIGNVGAVYLVMGDFSNAIDCHLEHLRLAKELSNKIEEARAYSNLGSSYHYQRNFEQAIIFHNHVLQIAAELSDQTIEARAYAGLGHAARCVNDLSMAKLWHEKQLDMALATKDRICEGRACSNLGIIYQLIGDYEAALKLHQVHLTISSLLHDRGGMGRSYGNIGNAYNSLGFYEQAIKYYKKELSISKEVNDRSSEASTHGNLAIAYQALRMFQKALVHYHSHLSISRELKEAVSEACALLNLGNCHSSAGDFSGAIPFYENYLMLSQELADLHGEEKACHLLGYIHYSLGHFREAVRYYNQDLILAKDCHHSANMGRAYCNLGLTYLALGNYSDAIECQTHFLSLAEGSKCVPTTFRALSNIGNILVKMAKMDDAIKIFQRQIVLAKSSANKSLEAAAYGSLGMIHRMLKKYDYALGFHTQELRLLHETNDLRGQCRAHGNLGSVHMSIGHYTAAIKSYEEMLMKAKELSDSGIEGQAYGNLGIARMNIGNYEDAATYFEQQLSVLESLTEHSNGPSSASTSSVAGLKAGGGQGSGATNLCSEQGQAYSNLGDCFTVLCDYEESIRCYQKALEIAINTLNRTAEEKCSRSIAMAFKGMGNSQETIHWFERRLAVALTLTTRPNYKASSSTSTAHGHAHAHGNESLKSTSSGTSISSLGSTSGSSSSSLVSGLNSNPTSSKNGLILKAVAYQELGLEYQGLHSTEQAISCFQQELAIITKQLVVHGSGSDDFKDMESSTLFNLGQCFYQIGNYPEALKYYELNLSTGIELNSVETKLRGYASIGLVYESLNNFEQALAFQEQHLSLATQIDSPDEKLNAFCSIGRLHYALGNQIQARAYLQESLQLVEKLQSTSNSPARSAISLNRLCEEEATIQYFLGLVLWKQGELESAEVHLEAATKLLESIQQDVIFKSSNQLPSAIIGRHQSSSAATTTTNFSTLYSSYSSSSAQSSAINYSLQLYDRQIASYQTLQRVLVSLGKTEQTLLVAEKCRTIANSVLVHQQHPALSSAYGGPSHTYCEVKGEDEECSTTNNTKEMLYSLPYSTASTTTTIPIQLISSVDALLARVNRHRTAALYYSLSGSFLFAWLLIPDRGIVKFHEFSISDDDEEIGGIPNESKSTISSLFSYYIQRIRSALGIDYGGGAKNVKNSGRSSVAGEDEEEQDPGNDLWAMHMEELGDRLNHEHDRTGFLRMISRNHRFNCSSYSLSSLFSVGSTTGSVKSIPTSSSSANNNNNIGNSNRSGSTRSCKVRSRNGGVKSATSTGGGGGGSNSSSSSWHGQSSSCIRSLYQILIAPFDEELNVLDKTCFRELYLVLESDLFLIPFSILRNSPSDPHLYERFKLIVIPSVSSIRSGPSGPVFPHQDQDPERGSDDDEDDDDVGSSSSVLVVGSPLLPSSVAEQWNWCPIPRAENEAGMVGEILRSTPLVGPNATKQAVLDRLCSSQAVHFATHISWRLSGIVLSPSPTSYRGGGGGDQDGDGEEDDCLPPILSDYLLTAADLLKLRLRAKLVVLSSCHTRETQSILNSECITSICRALLASGVSTILIPLWPVPEIASKIFFRSFYSALLQGSRMSTALSEGISTVQHTKHFAHPANWSGYLLIGSDIKLTSKSTYTNTAIWDLLKTPQQERTTRDALRVTLHLVEKSLQRINNGQKTVMYTTQKSIENKIGSNVKGWKDVLISVGFRFEPSSNDLPAAVFFPQEDSGERLVKCSNSLQAILGLPSQSIHALSKIFTTPEIGSDIVAILRQSIAQLSSTEVDDEPVQVKINVKLWGIAGCHELLASLGFDLIEVGEHEVILGVGSHVALRLLQLTLEAALSLCEAICEMDDEENSRNKANLERNVSLESLDDMSNGLSSHALPSPTTAYLLRQQQIGMGGGGAFTSYVRSRGEPDGHTNLAPEISSQDAHHFSTNSNSSCLNMNPYGSSTAAAGSNQNAGQKYKSSNGRTSNGSVGTNSSRESLLSHALGILRADSCSSSESSSMIDWENNELSTVRRKIAQGNCQLGPNGHHESSHYLKHFGNSSKLGRLGPVSGVGTIPYENQYEVNKSLKHVTWNVNSDPAKQSGHESTSQQPHKSPSSWLRMRNALLLHHGQKNRAEGPKGNSGSLPTPNNNPNIHEHLKSTQHSQMTRELPISDVYHERNIGLDLAPSLSKLLLANTLSFGQLLENGADEACFGGKSDVEAGATSMDDTISTFDQLSLAEDSAPESSVDGRQRRISRFPRIKASASRQAAVIPPIPMRRTLFSPSSTTTSTNVRKQLEKARSQPPRLHHLSINLSPPAKSPAGIGLGQDPHGGGGAEESSSSSSKSSPSDLSRRDEGDGRSLTDSQYGSYSPSMAQNTLTRVQVQSLKPTGDFSGATTDQTDRPTPTMPKQKTCQVLKIIGESEDYSDVIGSMENAVEVKTNKTKNGLNSSGAGNLSISLGNYSSQKSSEC